MLILAWSATTSPDLTNQQERIIAHSLSDQFKACMLADANSDRELACWQDELSRQDKLLEKTFSSLLARSSRSRQAKLRSEQGDWVRHRDRVCKWSSEKALGDNLVMCRLNETILRTHDVLELMHRR